MKIQAEAHDGPLKNWKQREVIPLARTYQLDLRAGTVKWLDSEGNMVEEDLLFEVPAPGQGAFGPARTYGSGESNEPACCDLPSCVRIQDIDFRQEPGQPDYSFLLVSSPSEFEGLIPTKRTREIKTKDALKIRTAEEELQRQWILDEAGRIRKKYTPEQKETS